MLIEISAEEREAVEGMLGPLGTLGIGRKDVIIRADDGTELMGTLTRPMLVKPLPVILIRTPYGRLQMNPVATYLAAHGYAVLVQDTRGASSYFFEAADGRRTVEWLEEKDWFAHALALVGFSYLGFTAWATASTRPSSLRAMVVAEYSSDRTSAIYPGGAFALEQALTWSAANEPGGREEPLSAATFEHLPLEDADRAATGATLPFYQERLEFEPGSPHWNPIDFSWLAEQGTVPVLFFDGWYDYHRIPILNDFERVGRAGAHRRLVFGPWTHTPFDMLMFLDETLAWLDLHLKNVGEPRAEATLFDTGAHEWIQVNRWPQSTEPGMLSLWLTRFLIPPGRRGLS
ncbi:CocE/NonD family hydrolase [Microbacterium aurum]